MWSPKSGLFLITPTLTIILFTLFQSLPPLIPCAERTAQSLGLALCAGLGLSLLAGARLWRDRRFRWALGAGTTLLLLTVWLGFYPVSPLFASGRIPVLQGFTFVTQRRDALNVAPGGWSHSSAGRRSRSSRSP